MVRLIVHARAEGEVDEIAGRIARDNLRAALRFYDRVEETFARLKRWPQIGTRRHTRHPSLQGLRSYPIRGYRSYLILYLPQQDRVEVLHVIHGSRDIDAVMRENRQ